MYYNLLCRTVERSENLGGRVSINPGLLGEKTYLFLVALEKFIGMAQGVKIWRGAIAPLIPTALLCSLKIVRTLSGEQTTYSVNQDLISSYNRRRKIKGTVFTYIIIKDSGMIRFDLIRRLLKSIFLFCL